MKKLSLVKIGVALLIVNSYMFVCGVTGTIGGEAMSASAPTDGTNEAGGLVDDLDEAGGQGTLDFLVPDETSTGFVSIDLMEMAPLSLSSKFVQSTYNISDVLDDAVPEDTEEILGETDDATYDGTNEIVITLPEEDDVVPAETTAATTTAAPVTEPPQTTATTTTAAPVQTATSVTTMAGIPVEGDSTTTGADDQPDMTEPDDSPSGNDVSGEVLYVRANGGVVSGSALEIVGRMTQHEVGNTFAPEAIKAQAVAAYTYVKFCNDYGTYPSVGLASTVSDAVEVLVESVIGKAIYYNGSIIQAVYSASSAGYTASSINVWGTDYPYLESRFCDLDKQYDPNYGKTTQFTSAEIKSNVKSVTGIELTGDPSGWLSIEGRVDGNYVGQMSVGGYHSYTDSSGNSVKITGRVFRERIMNFGLRSSAFDISYDAGSDTFTFTTYGYGHGVGMSQNGANALATYLGYDYKQILTYYYSGTEVY